MSSGKKIGSLFMGIGLLLLFICSIMYIEYYTNIPDLLKNKSLTNQSLNQLPDSSPGPLPNERLTNLWWWGIIFFIFGSILSKGSKELKLKELKNLIKGFNDLVKMVGYYLLEIAVIIYVALLAIVFFNPTLPLLFKIALLITGFILFYAANEARK